MVKKISILMLAVSLFAATGAIGQTADRSEKILSSLAAKLKAMKAFDGDIAITYAGDAYANGKFVVEGEKYKLTVDQLYMYVGIEILGDGKTKYEINHKSQEVTIGNINPADNDILSNPAKAFYFPADMFTYKYKGEVTVGGRRCDVVELKPKKRGHEAITVTLSVDRVTSLPAALNYRLDGSDDEVDVVITRIGEYKGTTANAFKFNKSEYKDYELIDFR